jgi:hypothetical protein
MSFTNLTLRMQGLPMILERTHFARAERSKKFVAAAGGLPLGLFRSRGRTCRRAFPPGMLIPVPLQAAANGSSRIHREAWGRWMAPYFPTDAWAL